MDVASVRKKKMPEPTAAPIENTFNSAFAGREDELKHLQGFWQKARAGAGRLVVVFGEPGVGKKKLVAHFTAGIKNEDPLCITVSLKNTPEYEPYLPFLNIIQTLKDAGVSGNDQAALKKWASTTNNEANGGSDSFNTESLYSLQANHRLAQQNLLTMILEASRRKPLLITLLDAHCAPSTTWQFIHYLSESISENPILLITTVRKEGGDKKSNKTSVHMDVIQRMNRERLVNKLHLNPFQERDIRKFMFQTLRQTDFSSRFINLVQAISKGVPAKLVQLMVLMIENGLVYREGDIWVDSDGCTREILVSMLKADEEPEDLSKRLAGLTEQQKSLLQYAGLFEQQFDNYTLTAVLHRPRIRVLKDLLSLQQQKILHNLDENTYQFAHPSYKKIVAGELGGQRKQAMHLEIAQAIEENLQDNIKEKIYLLAHHYYESGQLVKSFHYLHQAGKQALTNFAFLEAQKFYTQAVKLLTSIDREVEKKTQVQMIQEAAWATRVLGNRRESLEFYEKALALCTSPDNKELQHQLLVQKGLTHFQLNEWEAAKIHFLECLSEIGEDNEFATAMAHYGLGNVFFELSQYSLSQAHFEKALEITRSIQAKTLTANILNNLGALENVNGNRLNAISLYSQSVPVYQSLGDNLGLARVYNNIGITWADERDWEKANEFYGKSLGVSDVMGVTPLKTLTFLNRVYTLIHLHKFSEAREYNFKAYRHLRKLKDELGLAEYHKNQGIIEREEGNFQGAKTHFTTALGKYKKLNSKLGGTEAEYEMGLLAVKMNDVSSAKIHFQAAYMSFVNLGLTEKAQVVEAQLSMLSEKK